MDVEVDPNVVFVENGSLLLDPRNAEIANKIDKNISEAFRMILK